MNVLDVFSEVCNCLFGRLAHKAVRVMHVPESCYLAVVDLIEDLLEPLCVSINAVCLDEESNVHLFSVRNELSDDGNYDVVVDLLFGSGVPVAQYADERCAELVGEFDICPDLSDSLVLCSHVVDRLTG